MHDGAAMGLSHSVVLFSHARPIFDFYGLIPYL